MEPLISLGGSEATHTVCLVNNASVVDTSTENWKKEGDIQVAVSEEWQILAWAKILQWHFLPSTY